MHPFTSSYIGIDPSLRSTGFAAFGVHPKPLTSVILPPTELSGVKRLAFLRDELHELLMLQFKIEHACIEGPAIGAVNRADDIGQLRGVLLIMLHDMEIPTTIVAPKSLKKFATRSGNAKKDKMIECANETFGLDTTSDDIADAVWLAQIARALSSNVKMTRPQLEVVHGIRNPKPKKRSVSQPKSISI
jgi:Holliday junction resolvasome RuvABC endonuclease subunit